MLNPQDRAALDVILAKSPADVTEIEHGVLQARRSYLTGEQRVNFGITEDGDVASDASEDAKPARRSRGAAA